MFPMAIFAQSSDTLPTVELSERVNFFTHGLDTVKVNFFYYVLDEKKPVLRIAAGYMIIKGFEQRKLYTCKFEKIPKSIVPVAVQFPMDKSIYE